MKKRILSLLLAALMVLCVIPVFSLVSYAKERETAEDYKTALGITTTDDDRAHFVALIEAYGYDGMPTVNEIKTKLDGYKNTDATYTNEEIARKLSYSVAPYFAHINAQSPDEIYNDILTVLNSDTTLGTKDMATKIAKALADKDLLLSGELADIIGGLLKVRGFNLYDFKAHETILTNNYNWANGTMTITNALNSYRYNDLDTLVNNLVAKGITKTDAEGAAYTDTDAMKADMKADLIKIGSVYIENVDGVDTEKTVYDLVTDTVMAMLPVTNTGAAVERDAVLSAVTNAINTYPILVDNEEGNNIAYFLTEAGVLVPNTNTTESTNNVKIPLFFNIWDDLTALRNKTTYGSRRVDEFYKNFADIAVVSEDGEEKTAATAKFKAYLDYYFTAGAGNYGYYEDLWYDDGHLVSFIDFANLNNDYSVAHYTREPDFKIGGADAAQAIDSHFARFLDGSKYYNTDGTTTDNPYVLQYSWNMADRSYMKVIGGQNIGNYYMLGTSGGNNNATKTQIGVSGEGRLTLVKDETGRYDFNIFTQVYFSEADILAHNYNGLRNPADEGSNAMVNYTPNMWLDNGIYDGSALGGYTVESIFGFNNYHVTKQTGDNANSNSYRCIFGNILSENRSSDNSVVSIRVRTTDKVNYYTTYFGIGSNADGKFYSIPAANALNFDSTTFRMTVSGNFLDYTERTYDPNLSINGFKAAAGDPNVTGYYSYRVVPVKRNSVTTNYVRAAALSVLTSSSSVIMNDKDYYALRYYDVTLTDLQSKRNEFADLCYYYGTEITDTVRAIINANDAAVYNSILSYGYRIGDGKSAEFAQSVSAMTESLWYAENIAPLYAGTDDLYAEVDFTAINASTVGAIEDSTLDYIRMIEPRGDNQNAMLNSGNVSKTDTASINGYDSWHYYVRVSDGKMKGYYFMLMAAALNGGSADSPAVDSTLATAPTALYNWMSQNFYTPEQRAAADFVHPFLNTDGTFKTGTDNVFISTTYIYTATQVRDANRGTGAGAPIYNYNASSSSANTSIGYNKGTGYTVQYVAAYTAVPTNFQWFNTVQNAPSSARASGYYFFQNGGNQWSNKAWTTQQELQLRVGTGMDLAVVGTFDGSNATAIAYLDGAQLGTWADGVMTAPYTKTFAQANGWTDQNIHLGGFTPYYVRIFERDLTADEIANNHFVDLCRYYHVDTDLFRNADSAMQKTIIDSFKTVLIDSAGVNKQYVEDTISLTIFGVDKAELAQALIFAGFQARTNTNIGLRSVFVLNEDVLASLGDKVVGYGAMVGSYTDGDTFDSFTATYNSTSVDYANAIGMYNGESGFKLFTNESEKNDILTAKGISEGNYNVFALTTDFIKDATIKEVLEGTASVSGDFNQKLMYRAFIILTDGHGNYYTYYINATSDNYTANNGALSMYEVAKHYENDFGSYDTIKYVLENSGN